LHHLQGGDDVDFGIAAYTCVNTTGGWQNMQMTQQSTAHPGEVLRTEYLERAGITAEELAESVGIPSARITEIINGQRAISADTAMRLADRLGTTPQFWVTLQTNYDLSLVSQASHGRAPPRPKMPRRRR
jgi:addiction module HigA family antidote